MLSPDLQRSSTAAMRNRDPILTVLRDILPTTGIVLEIASGTGDHITHFAAALPALVWQPSDPSPEARASVAELTAASGLSNIRVPLALDASSLAWPIAAADAVIAINMVHISPWEATEGLVRGAGERLQQSGPLILYGPYRRESQPFAASNAAFDADLRGRNPAWGIRLVEDVAQAANKYRLGLESIVEMPANNLMLVFRRA